MRDQLKYIFESWAPSWPVTMQTVIQMEDHLDHVFPQWEDDWTWTRDPDIRNHLKNLVIPF